MADEIGLKKFASAPLLFLLLLALASTMRLNMLAGASPETLDVPGKYASIQEAINNAISGDVIFVHKGTYYEDIAINKSVSLVGEDRDMTVVYGSGASQPQYVISLIASGITVKGFTVKARTSIKSPIIIGSAGNVLENNLIENGFYGLQLSFSYNNVIRNNTISDNQYGVYLFNSGHNTFSENDIANNVVTGVEFHYSNDNVFSGNTLYNNNDGLTLYSSTGNNVLYHNNFNNTIQLLSDSTNSTNIWSLDGEGNYWSDYLGQDSNNDGIGDIPYNTDTQSGDSFPLMGQFYDLKILSMGQEYHVTLVSNSSVSNLKFELGIETGNKIVAFNVAGQKGMVGFGRIMIPRGLMDFPLIVLTGQGEITPTVLNASNAINAYLYFTWSQSDQTLSITSSETLRLYNDLLAEYYKLLADLNDLNATQNSLLDNLTRAQLESNDLLAEYYKLLADLNDLNATQNSLLDNLTRAQLESKYLALNESYYKQLSDYSRNLADIQNLTYVFAAATAIFLITTVYLSKRSNGGLREKVKRCENGQ